jgi:hypothetical protein
MANPQGSVVVAGSAAIRTGIESDAVMITAQINRISFNMLIRDRYLPGS